MDDLGGDQFAGYRQYEWPHAAQPYPSTEWETAAWPASILTEEPRACRNDGSSAHVSRFHEPQRSIPPVNVRVPTSGPVRVPDDSYLSGGSPVETVPHVAGWQSDDMPVSSFDNVREPMLGHMCSGVGFAPGNCVRVEYVPPPNTMITSLQPPPPPPITGQWDSGIKVRHADSCTVQTAGAVAVESENSAFARGARPSQQLCACSPGADCPSTGGQDFESFIDQFLGEYPSEARQVCQELSKSCAQAVSGGIAHCGDDAGRLTAQLSGIVEKCARDRENQRCKERSAKLKHAIKSFTSSGRSCLSQQQREAVHVQVLEQLVQKASDLLAAKGGRRWRACTCSCQTFSVGREEQHVAGESQAEGVSEIVRSASETLGVTGERAVFRSTQTTVVIQSSPRAAAVPTPRERSSSAQEIHVANISTTERYPFVLPEVQAHATSSASNNVQRDKAGSVTDVGTDLYICDADPGPLASTMQMPSSPRCGITEHSHCYPETCAGSDCCDAHWNVPEREGSGSVRHITLAALQAVYDLPINEAAKKLGLGVTVLKKFCRKFDIPRWPYRKLKSLEKLIASLQEDMMDQAPDSELLLTLEELKGFRQMILRDPSVDLETKVKRLRQANFKLEYKQRQASRGAKSHASQELEKDKVDD